MRGIVNPQKLIEIAASIFFALNAALFFLRESDSEWWLGDYQAYAGVSFDLHARAFVFFTFYLAIFVAVLSACAKKAAVECAGIAGSGKDAFRAASKGGTKFTFFIVFFLLVTQAALAIVDTVGVAGAVGDAPIYALPLLLFSPDGVYYAYALSDRNKNRFLAATLIYVLSNVFRGWAGFIVPLALVFYIRNNGFSKRELIFSALGFFVAAPILFVVRDYFRGGYSSYQLLTDSGLVGVSLLTEYSSLALKLILSRFDLYSNYIGVSQNFAGGLPDYVCLPIVENVFSKFILYPFGGLKCTPLGGVLPGELYKFFLDKGTSYSVVGGFFALPFGEAAGYFLSYFFVLLLTSVIVFKVINKPRYSNFFVFLAMVLLFQGWMYQFIYNFLGFVVGIFLLKITWSKSILK
jgi:hypothetical protein